MTTLRRLYMPAAMAHGPRLSRYDRPRCDVVQLANCGVEAYLAARRHANGAAEARSAGSSRERSRIQLWLSRMRFHRLRCALHATRKAADTLTTAGAER
jgi:hypothetical protein